MCEDRAWLDAFRRGEPEALERVFRVYAPYVLSILRRGVRLADGRTAPPVDDVDDQQDLLHDVFVACFQESTRSRYDGVRPFAPYVGQIARFCLFDRARAWARRPALTEMPVETEELWSPEQPLPDEHSADNEERALVRAFRTTLSEQDNALLDARFVAGLSERDAASHLGSTRQKIRTWERQIRERFRAFLAAPKNFLPPGGLFGKSPTQREAPSELVANLSTPEDQP